MMYRRHSRGLPLRMTLATVVTAAAAASISSATPARADDGGGNLVVNGTSASTAAPVASSGNKPGASQQSPSKSNSSWPPNPDKKSPYKYDCAPLQRVRQTCPDPSTDTYRWNSKTNAGSVRSNRSAPNPIAGDPNSYIDRGAVCGPGNDASGRAHGTQFGPYLGVTEHNTGWNQNGDSQGPPANTDEYIAGGQSDACIPPPAYATGTSNCLVQLTGSATGPYRNQDGISPKQVGPKTTKKTGFTTRSREDDCDVNASITEAIKTTVPPGLYDTIVNYQWMTCTWRHYEAGYENLNQWHCDATLHSSGDQHREGALWCTPNGFAHAQGNVGDTSWQPAGVPASAYSINACQGPSTYGCSTGTMRTTDKDISGRQVTLDIPQVLPADGVQHTLSYGTTNPEWHANGNGADITHKHDPWTLLSVDPHSSPYRAGAAPDASNQPFTLNPSAGVKTYGTQSQPARGGGYKSLVWAKKWLAGWVKASTDPGRWTAYVTFGMNADVTMPAGSTIKATGYTLDTRSGDFQMDTIANSQTVTYLNVPLTCDDLRNTTADRNGNVGYNFEVTSSRNDITPNNG